MATSDDGGCGFKRVDQILNTGTLEAIQATMKHVEWFKKKSATIKECPGETKCVMGKLPMAKTHPPNERILYWPCPIFTSLEKPSDAIGRCAYGVNLANNFEARTLNVLSDLGVPKLHAENIKNKRDSIAVKAVEMWDGIGFLVLCGGTGVGKSFGAAYAVLRLLRGMFSPSDFRRPGVWTDIFTRGKSIFSWRHIRDLTVAQEAEKQHFLGAGVLVLDDLGSENTTPAVKELIGYLATKRSDNPRSQTIITANLSLEAMSSRYGDRFMDRIMACGKVVQCDGENIRMTR
jgi:DNA replication protein DnaC